MKITKTLGLTLLSSALLFTACKKEDAAPPAPACKVDKAYYYAPNATTPSSTATYTYTGNKLTKLGIEGDDLVFEYAGEKITKRSFMASGSPTVLGYDQVAYNADGAISKIESFGLSDEGTYIAFERVEFTYSAGKLSGLITYDLTSGSPQKTFQHTYTYTGNNITGVVETDHTISTPLSYTYSFTYDGNANYYKKQNAQALLIDPYLGGIDGVFLALFHSANNVTAISSNGGSLPVSYTLDERQSLKEVVLVVPDSGQIRVTYSNLCQ